MDFEPKIPAHCAFHLVLNLQRPSSAVSWGLKVSLFERRFVVVGSSFEEHVAQLVGGYWAAAVPFDPGLFSKNSSSNSQRDMPSFVRSLLSLPCCTGIRRSVLPGDCIIAIDGKPTSGFTGMDAITDHLRKNRQVSLVILRYPLALNQVRSFQTLMHKQHRNLALPDVAFRTAELSYHIIRNAAAYFALPSVPNNLVRGSYPASKSSVGVQHQLKVDPKKRPAAFQYDLPRNPLFRNDKGQCLLFCDGGWTCEDDPDEGNRHELFLPKIYSFSDWICKRKQKWRQNYNVYQFEEAEVEDSFFVRHSYKQKPHPLSHSLQSCYYNPTNSLFHLDDGNPVPYVDNNWEYDPEENRRHQLFLPPISDFADWLRRRKNQWRENYHVYRVEDDYWVDDESSEYERSESLVSVDFWTSQGHPSFQHWLASSTSKWKCSYSWNKRKRKRIEQESEQVVQISEESFPEWLRVRRNQWRILRRKRQRRLKEENAAVARNGISAKMPVAAVAVKANNCAIARESSPGSPTSVVQSDLILIDALLEDQERERKARKERPPLDISFVFDANLGCPDDVIALCFQFLVPMEHVKLLCINRKTRKALSDRQQLWRLLCPAHWKLPRRPRKPWHVLYVTKLQAETEQSMKRWDDLLAKVSKILLKGDHIQTVEKMVTEAETKYGFDVNYSSGVVCERNSLLNLAVIHQRHKVVRWFVESKNADIETFDRGKFTPLLNAAWAGDRYLVRFLLQKGARRSHIGTGHYTKPLASPDFKGLTAEGWAERRGHGDIAKLIRMGL